MAPAGTCRNCFMYKIIGADLKEYGPVSADEIRQWMAEGRANGQTMLQMAGSTEWRPLSTYPEFATALAGMPVRSNSPLSPEEALARDYEVDFGGCLTRSWELVKGNFWPVVGVTFLVWVVMTAVNQAIGLIYRVPMDEMMRNHEFSPSGVLLIISGMLLTMPIQSMLLGGLYNYFLKLIRHEEASVGDAFAGITLAPGQLALLGFVVGVLSLVGTALCIIPGIYLSVAWIFATPLVIDKKMGVWEAMEFSRKMVTRHWFMVFALLIVVALVSICGIFACCVGILVTMTIGWVALMYAYEDIFNRRGP
jgi:hypothetical protein